MNDFGVIAAPGTVRLERLLPGPIERIWAYLTESEKRRKWLAAGPMDLRVGGAVELRFRHADLSPDIAPTPERFKAIENGHVVHGQVTRCDPPRLLSFTWDHPPDAASEVTFELTTEGWDVRLVVTHRRLAERSAMISVAGGWHTHLAVLAERLQGRTPPAFWTLHTGIEAEYRARFAAAPA